MFYSDRPILNSEDDLLSRSSFAKKLAHTLMQFKTEDTFTLGLFGKWGSGKTSLINMMLQEISTIEKNLNDEDVESIEYQMQLREKLKNKQKIGESINE